MTDLNGQAATAELIGLLDQQQRIYQHLQQLSARQSQLIREADAEALLVVLSQRQELIDQLVDIGAQVEPFRQQWPTFWSALDEQEQAQLRERIDAVRGLLEAVIEQDEADRIALAAERDAVASNMKHVRQGAAAGRAYGAAGQSHTHSPRFTDREG